MKRRLSAEHKAKLAAAQRGKRHSAEHNIKISLARRAGVASRLKDNGQQEKI